MCPPGTDQTTRSPNQWLLYAPELEQRHSFSKTSDGWGTTFSEIVSGQSNLNVWDMLARPAVSAPRMVKVRSDCRRGRFDILSNELVDMILQYVSEDPVSTIALGFTCEGFWYLVCQHIHRTYHSCVAPWANTKIILQASYATRLPPCLVDSPAVAKAANENGSRMALARKIFWAGWGFKQPMTVTRKEEHWRGAAEVNKEYSGIPEARWNGLQSELSSSYLFSQDQPWVLRNLSLKQAIFSERLARRRTRKEQDCGKGMSLEDILLVKLYWLEYPRHDSSSLECRPGIWAGNCFDVVTEDVYRKECEEGWCDVTMEIERDVLTWKKTLN